MTTGMYKEFSNRLIETMKKKGYITTRSPSGICITTLARLADVSEQICRRYIRGDALPDYETANNIALHLNVSPGWLLFGEVEKNLQKPIKFIEDEVLHYILKKSYFLYQHKNETQNDYADFILKLIQEIREIDTSIDNLKKIIDLTINSISSYEEKNRNVFVEA